MAAPNWLAMSITLLPQPLRVRSRRCPGGVGPMTIACLLANTLTACCRANGLPEPEGLTA